MKTKKTQNLSLGKGSKPRPPASGYRGRLLLILCALAAAAGTWGFLEFVLWNKIPAELVGKWVVVEGPDEGGTVDFYRGGTMVAIVNNDGYQGIMKGTIRIEGKTIYVTSRHQQTGQTGTRAQKIK